MDVIESFDGTPIAYEANGSGSPTLVFVHGFSSDQTFWSFQVPYFSNRYQVISLDLAGHGKSGTVKRSWDMENYGKDVAAVCNHLELDHLILIGHSMGGAVIIEAANLIEGNVIELIGVDAIVYPLYSKTDESEIDKYIEPLEIDFEGEVKKYIQYWFPDQTHQDLAQKVFKIITSTPLSVSLPTLRSLHQWDFHEPISRTQTQYSCICSEETISEIDLKYFEDRIKIYPISGVRHLMMMEDPPSFNKLLNEVINKCL